jgi:hypothetical protein
VRGAKRASPKLRLIETPKPILFDSITRDSCLTRIRRLARGYQLHWVVEQATFDTPGLDCLDDSQLLRLLEKLEKARECIAEGISFEDAGLVENSAQKLNNRF